METFTRTQIMLVQSLAAAAHQLSCLSEFLDDRDAEIRRSCAGEMFHASLISTGISVGSTPYRQVFTALLEAHQPQSGLGLDTPYPRSMSTHLLEIVCQVATANCHEWAGGQRELERRRKSGLVPKTLQALRDQGLIRAPKITRAQS